MARGAERLFRGIVVFGAALGASRCGGDTETVPGDKSDAGFDSGVTADAPSALDASDVVLIAPDANEVDSMCDGVARTDASSLQPANNASDCEHPEQFLCVRSGCFCDPEAPLSDAECSEPSAFHCLTSSDIARYACVCAVTNAADCEHPQQFVCQDERCACDPTAPLSACDCPGIQMQFTCESYDPPTSCYCMFSIITV